MVQTKDVSGVANQVEGHPALQVGAWVGYAVSGGQGISLAVVGAPPSARRPESPPGRLSGLRDRRGAGPPVTCPRARGHRRTTRLTGRYVWEGL